MKTLLMRSPSLIRLLIKAQRFVAVAVAVHRRAFRELVASACLRHVAVWVESGRQSWFGPEVEGGRWIAQLSVLLAS